MIHPRCAGCVHLLPEGCAINVCAVVRSSLHGRGFHLFGPVQVAIGEYTSLIKEGEKVG